MSDSENTSQETMEENSGPSDPLYILVQIAMLLLMTSTKILKLTIMILFAAHMGGRNC